MIAYKLPIYKTYPGDDYVKLMFLFIKIITTVYPKKPYILDKPNNNHNVENSSVIKKMKRKISAISIVFILLITGLMALSAVGFEEAIAQNTAKLCYLHDTSIVDGSVWGRSSPFNPVVAIPSVNCFWTNKYKMRMGKTVITEPAI